MRRITLEALMFVMALLLCSAAYAGECKYPDIASALQQIGNPFPDFTNHVLLLRSPSEEIQWAGISQFGPLSGVLLAFNCDGRLMDIKEIGAVESLDFSCPPPGIENAVTVKEIDDTGTGVFHISYSIYALEYGQISLIWQHALVDNAFGDPKWGGKVDSFEVTCLHGQELQVIGNLVTCSPADNWNCDSPQKRVTRETYRWDERKRTYVCDQGCPEPEEKSFE